MENLINWEQIRRNELLLKTHIFTARQLQVLKKKLQNLKLDSTEKTYYYKFIKPKLKAILSTCNIQEFNIKGREFILEERIESAIKIIKLLQKKHKNQKIIISGSFLFNKTYQDIDVFIISKYKKEDYHWKKVHITFLNETALDSLFFASLSQISISNFKFDSKIEFKIRLKEILTSFELLINQILQKEDIERSLRDLLLQIEYFNKKIILNPQQLYHLKQKFNTKNKLKLISRYLIEALILNNSQELILELNKNIKDYEKLSQEYKNAENLGLYIKTYQEVLDFAN